MNAEERALEITGPCTCSAEYKDRHIRDPQCVFCQDAGDTVRALRRVRLATLVQAAEVAGACPTWTGIPAAILALKDTDK